MATTDSQKRAARAYYEKNRERLAERSRQWYRDNRHSEQVRSRQWYRDNKEQQLARMRLYRQNNKHKVAEYTHIRNATCAKQTPLWYEEDLVAELYRKRDELNQRYQLRLEIDHIIPINPKDKSVSGLHCWANLQLLADDLNSSKQDKYETDW